MKPRGHDLRKRIGLTFFNLAVAERTCGRHEEALNHFRQAWELSKRETDAARTELYRQDYCWQALRTDKRKLAQELISLGERYLIRFPHDQFSKVQSLNEQARYHLLTENYPMAAALAMEAILPAMKLDNTAPLTIALVTLVLVFQRTGDQDTALGIGAWAFIEAQRSKRAEMVTHVQRLLRDIRLRERDAIDRLMQPLLRPV